MSVQWVFAKQLSRSHRFLKHPQHLSLQKTKEAIALIVIITTIIIIAIQNPSKPSPPPPPLPLPALVCAYTERPERGAACCRTYRRQRSPPQSRYTEHT